MPLEFARMAGIGLHELVEDFAALFHRHAHAGVAHFETQNIAIALRAEYGADSHATLFGELDRIADKIGQNLAQPHGVGSNGARNISGYGRDKFDALGMRARAKQFDDALD